jgi:precorrin-6B methylase 2
VGKPPLWHGHPQWPGVSSRPMFLRFALAFLAAAACAAPVPRPDPLYELREGDPNGINKWFLGRQIARVMGHQAADWLERPERETEEKTEQMVAALNFRPGEMVADIGVGSGYVARKIAPRILPDGLVYGVDIQPEMLAVLARRMAMFRITNVRGVLGEEKDPKLTPESIDTMIMVDVYHEFEHPFEMIEAMVKALKPGGRIVFVEFRGEDPAVPIKEIHKMTEAQVKKEMGLHPLTHEETIGILPWQHIIIFRKPPKTAARGENCVQPPSRAALLRAVAP